MVTAYSKNLLLGALVLCVLIFCAVSIQHYFFNSTLESSHVPDFHQSTEYVAYWKSVGQLSGGINAYALFTNSVSNLTDAEQHVAAHLFGRGLFAAEGSSSGAVCDDKFHYGCLHEVIAQTVYEKGISAVPGMFASCGTNNDERTDSCRHGIGHALVMMLGHTIDGVKESLVQCDTDALGYSENPCHDAVFMEFNLNISHLEKGNRLFQNDFRAPCDEVGVQYRDTCFFRQPQWWMMTRDSQGGTDAAVPLFSYLGLLCRAETRNENERLACFYGIGKMAAQENAFVFERALEACTQSSSGINHDWETCINMATHTFVHDVSEGEAKARIFCAMSGGNECVAFTDPDSPPRGRYYQEGVPALR